MPESVVPLATLEPTPEFPEAYVKYTTECKTACLENPNCKSIDVRRDDWYYSREYKRQLGKRDHERAYICMLFGVYSKEVDLEPWDDYFKSSNHWDKICGRYHTMSNNYNLFILQFFIELLTL